jgi:hypothetical protein
MNSFNTFLALLGEITDPRRKEGKIYELAYVLLFSILAIVTGANSYRGIHTFMETHRTRLNAAFGLSWKRAPAYTAIRYILRGLAPEAIELAFRKHAELLRAVADAAQAPDAKPTKASRRAIAIDGKALRHSFDNFNDRKAAQLLSAFSTGSALILAHVEIDAKSNEIPAAQKLLAELDLDGRIVTLDAMHCQKNIRSSQGSERPSDRSAQGKSACLA